MTERKRVRLRAPAKVNLHLEVIRQRHDGYHEIETVLQAIGLYDTLRITLVESFRGGEPRVELLVTPSGAAPESDDNLCVRAARLFCQRQRVSGYLQIELAKDIPAGSGLGGGSSDAMATLLACDRLFGTGLEPAQLAALGAHLGSDVPFFLAGGTALGRGLGADLTPLPAIRVGHFLVVKPNFDLGTAGVYAGLKMGLTVRTTVANIRVIKPLIARFPSGTWFGYNRLEEVVLPAHPELQRALAQLREAAPVAMMTGSGSALYGVFQEEGSADHMASRIRSDFPFIRCVLPHPAGVQFLEE